jgi:hypothetical protein
MGRKAEPANTADPAKTAAQLRINRREGATDEELLTELAMSPVVRNTICSRAYATPSFSGDPPQLETAIELVRALCDDVGAGNLEKLTDMLAAQAVTLDTMFTEYARRSILNAGQYIAAAKDYANLAAKAQANCRTTIETLAKIKRGGSQTVKVVHVHEGAQAVVADTINQGGVGAQSIKQPQAKAADAPQPALPSPDEASNGVPVPGNAERQMSHAWRQEPRST